MTPVRSAISTSVCRLAGSMAEGSGRSWWSDGRPRPSPPSPLLRRCGDRHWRVLRRAQVAGDLVLVHGPNYQLVEHVIASGVELHGLALVLVFFLDSLVVGGDIQRVLAAFG